MFLKKRHLEIIKLINENNKNNIINNIEQIKDKLPEDFANRIIELNILDLITNENNIISLTENGKKLLEVINNVNLDNIPDIFVNSEIIKIMELFNETNYIPNNWLELLKERQLIGENNNLNTNGKTILEIYNNSHPTIYLTKDILSFIKGMPKIGLYSKLISYKDSKGAGENILNALEAMRLIIISPTTEKGKAFTITKAFSDTLKIAQIIPDNVPVIILNTNDFEMLNQGKTTKNTENIGYFKENNKNEINELGQNIINMYNNIIIGKTTSVKITPIYVLDSEIRTLNAIKDIEEKYKTNPEVIPTYNRIHKITELEDLGELLNLMLSKELIIQKVVNNKDSYWLTNYGKEIINYGAVSTDGVKAITYPKSGDVPIAEWVIKGEEEGTVKGGITEKGKFLINMSKSISRKPYLTKYDVAILLKLPTKKYIVKNELINNIKEYIGDSEENILKAIGECEYKGLIVELQNKCIKLTNLGYEIKEAIELAKTQELLNTKFAITPTTFKILETIYNNRKEFDKVWKEKTEGKGKEHKENEIILLAKLLKLTITIDEIKKSLVILKNTGFIGKKGLTKSGIKLIEGYNMIN